MEKMSQVGQKLMATGAMEQAMAGDVAGAVKKLATTEMKNEISSTVGQYLDPILAKTATMFEKHDKMPDQLKGGLTVEKIMDKAISAVNGGEGSEELSKLQGFNPQSIMGDISQVMSGEKSLDTVIDDIGSKLNLAGSAGSSQPSVPEGYRLADDHDLYDRAYLSRRVAKYGDDTADPRFVNIETGKTDYPAKLSL